MQRKHESAKKKELPCASRRHGINTYQESASEKVEGRHDPLFPAVLSHLSSSRLMLQASIKFDDIISVCAGVLEVLLPVTP